MASRLKLSKVQSVAGAQGSKIRKLQDGVAGPPGTILSFEVGGFNNASPLGNLAVFKSLDGSSSFEVPLGLWPQEDADSDTVIAKTVIPPLPSGPATLVLQNLSTGYTTDVIDVTVEPALPLGRTPAAIIDEYYATALAAVDEIRAYLIGEVSELEELGANLAAQRTNFQQLAMDPAPEIQDILTDIAITIVGSDAIAELEASLPGLTTQQGGGLCLTPEQVAQVKSHLTIITTIERVANVVLCVATIFTLNPALAVGCGFAIIVTILTWEIDWSDSLPKCDDEDRNLFGCAPAPASGPPPTIAIRGQQAPPPSTFTGMGSGILPGGDGCGNASSPPPMVALRGAAAAGASLLDIEPGRIIIRALADGDKLPFTGRIDAGGYFYVPFLEGGADIELIAIDTLTGDTRTVNLTGPEVGESVFVFFDFLSDSGPPAATVSWDGGGDGTSWADPQNWSGDILPGPDDDVVIDVPGDITVVHSGAAGTTVINRLTCRENLEVTGGTLDLAAPSQIDGDFSLSGTLDGNGDLTVAGTSSWSNGTITGLGTLIVPAGATLEISGPTTKNLRRNLDNSGTVLWTGGDVFSGDAAIFNNLAGALFDIQTDGSFNGNAFGAVNLTLNNDGLVRKSVGAGISEFRGLLMTSDGSVEVHSGAIRNWFSNGSYGGTLTGSGDGEYQVGSGTHTFEAGSSITVPNFTTLGGGTTTIAGSYDVTDTTDVQAPLSIDAGASVGNLGATLFVNGVFGDIDLSSGGVHSVPTLTIVGGVLTGSDELTVTAGATMTGGSMLGAGKTVIPDGVTLTLNGGGVHGLGRNIDNGGTVVLQDGFVHAGGTFDNLPSGLIELQVDGPWNGNALGAPTLTLFNGGTIRKSGGSSSDSEFRGTLFDGDGTVEIQSGTFTTLFTSATLGGTFSGTPGTTLQAGDGSHTFESSSSITVPNFTSSGGTTTIEGSYDVSGTTEVRGTLNLAAGATIVDLGATLHLNGGAATADLSSGSPLTVPTLTLTAGTLTGSDELTVTGSATWTGGVQAGSGKTIFVPGVPVEISGTNLKTLRERTIDIEGTATWIGTGQIFGGFGAVLNILATGVFEVQNDTTFNGTGAGGGPITTVNVAGTLRKTMATGVSDWSLDCQDASGTFDFQTGDIVFSQGTCP